MSPNQPTTPTEASRPEGESAPTASPSRVRARRGFAVMNTEQVREIARQGGRAAHHAGTAHEFTTEEARAAGRKGGLAPHRARARRAVADEGTPPAGR